MIRELIAEIETQIEVINNDYRIPPNREPANVQSNSVLALIQVQKEAERKVLVWVLDKLKKNKPEVYVGSEIDGYELDFGEFREIKVTSDCDECEMFPCQCHLVDDR